MCTRIIEFTKASGSKTNAMEEGSKYLQMVTLTKEPTTKENPRGEAFTLGQTAKFMTENGRKERSTATVFGKVRLETLILVSGLKTKLKGMEYMSGKITINTKESGSRT